MVILKKIMHILSYIVYFLIIVYGLCSMPILFGKTPLVVLSGSMEPAYHKGSILYYEEVPQSELKEGDVITYVTDGGNFVSHRILNINDGLYETKGDANQVSDPNKVSFNQIKGKVMNITIPLLGYYIQFVGQNTYLVIVAVIILVSEFLLSNVKTVDIEKNGKE